MDNAHAFLENLALVLCVAAATTVLFHRLRLPVVFGYLLAGMIVGPYVPIPLAVDEETIRTLSELGVILLMFSLGLEFRLRRVVQVAGTSGIAALAETSLMLGLGYTAGQLLGWSSLESVFAGAIVAISSTTIIAKAFEEHRVAERIAEIVFGILIVEDLIAIFLVAILTAVASGAGLSASALAVTGIRLVTFLVGLVVVGLLFVPRMMRAVVRAGRPEMTLVASIGICFAAALLALSFGYSVALGAFIAGSLVAESGKARRIERLVHPVRDLFVAIFFVSVGMLIDPGVLAAQWVAVLALVVVVVFGKIFAVSIAAFLMGNGLRPAVQTGMSLAQIGEFSFIIAAIGVASGGTRAFIYPVAVAVSAVTTLTTPWLIKAAGPVALWVDRKLPRSIQTFASLYGSWIERLRAAGPAAGNRPAGRRLVRLIALDAALLAAVIIGGAVELGRFTTLLGEWFGTSAGLAGWLVVAGGAVVALPLLIGLVRSSHLLAHILADRALPRVRGPGVDLAAAPRGTLVATLQAAILLIVAIPLLAVAQPFLRGVPALAVLAVVVLLLSLAFFRSTRNLHGHAQAGAEVIVSALATQMAEAEDSPARLSQTMEHVTAMLPGLGEPVPLMITRRSSAVGRTLAELNLRGITGATVLAVIRVGEGERRSIAPSGRERLLAGDVLAVAGTSEAVAAAAELLEADAGPRSTREMAAVAAEPE